ncbi:MAG: DUF1330 domain-containing protein [Saprospiraceae bacterium]|nr:DUF1330 domain-containing protein [Saprospiraceae bacterium]
MIFITQLIYLQSGGEESYNEFEAMVLPLLPDYGGQIMLRLRPDKNSVIEQNMDTPYEIHLISFESQEGLDSYIQDDIRQKYLPLKEKSIASTVLYQGVKK